MSSDSWVRVQCRQGLRSAGVRGTRKRGMGKETGCESARNTCLIIWHFSVSKNLGYPFRHLGYISAKFHSLKGPLKGRRIVLKELVILRKRDLGVFLFMQGRRMASFMRVNFCSLCILDC